MKAAIIDFPGNEPWFLLGVSVVRIKFSKIIVCGRTAIGHPVTFMVVVLAATPFGVRGACRIDDVHTIARLVPRAL
jgi:hypothetical protein